MEGRAISEDLRTEIEEVMDAFLEENVSSYNFLGYEIKSDPDGEWPCSVKVEGKQLETISDAIRYILGKFAREVYLRKMDDMLGDYR